MTVGACEVQGYCDSQEELTDWVKVHACSECTTDDCNVKSSNPLWVIVGGIVGGCAVVGAIGIAWFRVKSCQLRKNESAGSDVAGFGTAAHAASTASGTVGFAPAVCGAESSASVASAEVVETGT